MQYFIGCWPLTCFSASGSREDDRVIGERALVDAKRNS